MATEVAEAFVKHFYGTFAAGAAGLAGLYVRYSVLLDSKGVSLKSFLIFHPR